MTNAENKGRYRRVPIKISDMFVEMVARYELEELAAMAVVMGGEV